MAANSIICEAIWIHKLLVELIDEILDDTVIYCDKQSCIKLSEYPLFHDWPKHSEINYHFKGSVQKRVELLQ